MKLHTTILKFLIVLTFGLSPVVSFSQKDRQSNGSQHSVSSERWKEGGVFAGSASTVTFSGSSQEVNVTALNATTPTDSDITFNHVVIDGTSVKLFYFKNNDRKLNINNFTVNVGALVTLYSNPL